MTTSKHYNPGPLAAVNPSFMDECSRLYSAHYGYWTPQPGEIQQRHIKQTPAKIREMCKHHKSWIAYARELNQDDLVAYAIAIQDTLKDRGPITWVTQLVVHKAFRRQNVAKELLHSLWGLTDHYAWGLVSANPFAVRALETATRRRCDPARISESKTELLDFGKQNISYIGSATELEVDGTMSRINTDFDLDHALVPKMIADVTDESKPWLLGSLQRKYEWFAFTFRDQKPTQWSRKEVSRMLNASDHITRDAYSRMTLDKDHSWAQHTTKEVSFIYDACGLTHGSSVLDFGCGAGRHCYQLAINGLRVCGIDFSETLIKTAKQDAERDNLPIEYTVADCRYVDLGKTFDAVICIYDVIGSFAEKSHNYKIIRNIAKHLSPGGLALISVMNMGLTSRLATQRFDVNTDIDKLQALSPSTTMERTGAVFDPDYFLLDEKQGVVYRKEQFTLGVDLPAELLVRDRRYVRKEISGLVASVGLDVEWCRCVGAGRWEEDYPDDHDRAKEILLLCSKPSR